MHEHPSSPADAVSRPCARSPRHHRHHAGAPLGVRAGGLIPGISGELFRQFAVTVAVAMFLSAINA
jgi:hypothetical protein